MTALIQSGLYFTYVWFALPWVGLEATGIAYLVANLFYFLAVYLIVNRVNAFRWSFRNVFFIFTLATMIGFIHGAAWFALEQIFKIGLVLITGMVFYSIYRLNQLVALGNWLRGQFSGT